MKSKKIGEIKMDNMKDQLIKQLLDNQEKISRGEYKSILEDKFSNLKTIKECLEDITK